MDEKKLLIETDNHINIDDIQVSTKKIGIIIENNKKHEENKQLKCDYDEWHSNECF